MLDMINLPRGADVRVFPANSLGTGTGYTAWSKPRGKTMFYCTMVGSGGGGGAGAVGAASTAGGGGGGGSGAISSLVAPLLIVPDQLFVSVGHGGAGGASGIISYLQIEAGNTTFTLCRTSGGGSGGNASGGTGGTVGAAAGASSFSSHAALFVTNNLVGQAGTLGGGSIAGTAVNYGPQITMGGTGGGGLTVVSSGGNPGGAITVNTPFLGFVGGAAGTSAPTAGGNGVDGGRPLGKRYFSFTGGTGGGSSGLSAGSGSNGGNGGNGGMGSGGGGGGAAFTGFTAGVGGRGGGGLCIIVCW